jgi:quercetin dioxygenase-like cupin family protein
MALPHAGSGERIDLLLDHGGEVHSIALAKTAQLELIRLRLQKGKTMPTHQVAGEMTLHCLQGEIVCEAHGRGTVLRAGQMVYLAGAEPHALQANQDSLALLTILLHPV